jgi:SpoVK/Ycf46/Vps4 family AAA+-type ATPase
VGAVKSKPARSLESLTQPKLSKPQVNIDYPQQFKSLPFQALQAGVKRVSSKPVAKLVIEDTELLAVGSKAGSLPSIPIAPSADPTLSTETDTFNQDHPKLLKPPLKYDSTELQELAAQLTRDIFTMNPNVSWNSIAGLDKSKRLIKEAIVFPIKFPELFRGILKPWKGILLYGPPGMIII